MTIYGDVNSGNCYKVKLTAELLGIPYKWIHVDILNRETQSQAFLAKNPNGKIPCLVLTSGDCLAESNAIINYLAKDSSLYPNDPLTQAYIQQWQFFEQYSHEPYIAVARFIKKYLGLPKDKEQDFASKQEGGHKALTVIEKTLAKQVYLVNDQLSTADISLFAYTHVADEGGFDLDKYPNIKQWIKRIERQSNYIAIG
ncbi:glutathione S-transferase family protein [Thalassotalea agarivorans]|uniref:glutathione S-transferase family protein n=1 Tax=Thalassotalea agarivorans TaxID=349064 RepID=UPI000B81CFA2|nr:glutathione S-transferase family protein [Thalassotalea agarivorans]